jgi:hypothetical protein
MAVNLKRLPPKQAKGVTSNSIHLSSFSSAAGAPTAGLISTDAGQPPVAHHCDSAFFAERGTLTGAESIAGHHTRTEAA